MNQSGQKLWGLLLVIDSFFVVIFGGAFAAKLYESWQTPAREFTAPIHELKPALPKPLRAVSSIPQHLKKATISQSPTPAAPKPIAAQPPQTQKQKNQVAKTHLPSYKEPQILPSRGPEKARGVVFHYYGKKSHRVFLIASFIRGRKEPLKKAKRGGWKAKVFLMPGNYRYQFLVDGRKILDPRNPRHKGRFSFFSLEK